MSAKQAWGIQGLEIYKLTQLLKKPQRFSWETSDERRFHEIRWYRRKQSGVLSIRNFPKRIQRTSDKLCPQKRNGKCLCMSRNETQGHSQCCIPCSLRNCWTLEGNERFWWMTKCVSVRAWNPREQIVNSTALSSLKSHLPAKRTRSSKYSTDF